VRRKSRTATASALPVPLLRMHDALQKEVGP
jgi:hypothetical protein